LGSGPANSEIIAAGVTSSNCAAKMCLNLVRNGKSDWFLGSSEEMLIAKRSLYAMDTYLESAWTSTQANASQAKSTYYSTSSNGFLLWDDYKTSTNYVYPMRRY
jgi:hypothetical protein